MYNTAMAHRSHPSYRNTEVQKIENISMIPTSTKKKLSNFLKVQILSYHVLKFGRNSTKDKDATAQIGRKMRKKM